MNVAGELGNEKGAPAGSGGDALLRWRQNRYAVASFLFAVSPALCLVGLSIPGVKLVVAPLVFTSLLVGPFISVLFALIAIRKNRLRGAQPRPVIPGLAVAAVGVCTSAVLLGFLFLGHLGL